MAHPWPGAVGNSPTSGRKGPAQNLARAFLAANRSKRSALAAQMIGYASDSDTVVVSSMDRLARSLLDLNQIVRKLVAKGVVLKFIAELKSASARERRMRSRSSS